MHLKTTSTKTMTSTRLSESNSVSDESNNINNKNINETMSGNNGSTCTSIYISQPSTVSSTILVNSNSNLIQIENSESSTPILTIQVNQDNQTSQISTSSTGVNVVSCFRAASPTVQIVKGSENSIQSLLQNVSVHKSNNHENNEESVNNENNHNIISISNINGNKSQSKPIKSENLNEISVDICEEILSENHNNNSNDYPNMDKDRVELIKSPEKIVITTGTGTQQSSSSPLNQITTQEITSIQSVGNNQSESAKPKSNSNNTTATEAQMSREQRRRERRQRRQAQSHRQHAHVSVHHPRPQHPLPHHNNTHSNNSNHASGPGHGNLRPNYDILPDILNNHLPPPYTTLPLQLPAQLSIPVPPVISPVPVDDCRFSFPIPVMRR